jgi:hypothetical protein
MKNNILRNLFVLLVIFSFAFIYLNCDDAGVETKETQFCISDQISNWTLGAKTLHAYVKSSQGGSYSVAECQVDAGGNFNLCLPETVSDTTLFSSDSIFYIGCSGGNVTFNPPDVRGTEISSFKIKDGTTVIGYIRKNNYDTLYIGAFSLLYIWVNKNVTVTGTEICSGDSLKFDGSAVSGWDKVVKNCTNLYSGGRSYLYNTNEPAGAIWEYISY